MNALPVCSCLAGYLPDTELFYPVEVKNLLFKFAYYKAKTLLSMAPFSIILVGDFCVIIYRTKLLIVHDDCSKHLKTPQT